MTQTQLVKAGKFFAVGMFCLLRMIGCKSEADRKDELYREQTKNICTSVLKEPLCSEKSKALVAKVLAGLAYIARSAKTKIMLPFQGVEGSRVGRPRALPWAELGWPFGLE